MSTTTAERVTVTCPVCRNDRGVSARTAREIETGRGSRRCQSCGTTAGRIGPVQIDADMPRLDDAACAGTDPGMWFADKPQNPTDDPHWREPTPMRNLRIKKKAEALALCRSCPALEQCRAWVEQHPEMTAYGIWAGTTSDQRRKQQGRQRKRKAAA